MRTYHQINTVDSFNIFLKEAEPLFKENNTELDFFGLNVNLDVDTYHKLISMNRLRAFTIRENDELIGYSTFIIQKHLQHVDHLQANQDVLFISSNKRGYGIKFLIWCENQLKREGISFIFRSVTRFNDWSLILKRLEYSVMDTIYMKDLRE